MTNSNILTINPSADFEDQSEAVRGLLYLVSDGVRASADCATPATIKAICNINEALVSWLDENLPAELMRRASGSSSAATRQSIPFVIAAE